MPEISGLYLQGEEEGGEEWEEREKEREKGGGFRETKINISLDFVVLIS